MIQPIEALLRKEWGTALRTHVSLAPFTTFRIGGPAEFFLEFSSPLQLRKARMMARQHGIPFYFLGGGSNVLVSDEGIPGLTVVNRLETISWSDSTVWVGSGYSMDALVSACTERGYQGLQFAAGIPGTVGGALVGGAGAFGHLVGEFLVEAQVLDQQGRFVLLPAKQLGIGYRESIARSRGYFILSAVFGKWTVADPRVLWDEIARIKEERRQKHPGPDLPTAGSFFKNLPPEKPGQPRIPAGKLLDQAGFKGVRYGGAGVFEKHANMIVNHGEATARDVNHLAQTMENKIKELFHLSLEREVQYLK